MKTCRYIISIFLLFGSFIKVDAQASSSNVKVDSVKSEKNKYLPTEILFGIDILNGAKSFMKDDVEWFNFMGTIDLYRYSFSVDYGRESHTQSTPTTLYENEGSYLKFGPDVNLLFGDPDKSSIFVGLRYATNTFSDNLSYNSNNPIWGDQQDDLENNDLKAKWFEAVGGMRVRLFNAVWMGYTGRFKFGVDTFTDQALIPNYIPGYGRADLLSTWEFNYWLMIRIPVRRRSSSVTVELDRK